MSRVVSYDGHTEINNGTDYSATFNVRAGLPLMQPVMLERTGVGQILAGANFAQFIFSPLEITIENESSFEVLKRQLHQWFDGKDRTTKELVIENDDGSLDRYQMVYPMGMAQKGGAGGKQFVVSLVADGASDPHHRWRESAISSDTWNITASGQTNMVDNTGEDEAYPIFTIQPTSTKTNGYDYRRWIALRWNCDRGATRYPVDITNDGLDTASLIPSKMQADGDDLRVWVDGTETWRLIQDINTSTTQVWITLDFAPKVELAIADSIASSGAVPIIDFAESTANLPDSGVVVIDSEAFVYTGKNDTLQRITGVTRASRGTSMAAHSAGTIGWWAQHDIWILYGNSSVGSNPFKISGQPVFNLTSTNTSWDYDTFKVGSGNRTAEWIPDFDTGNQEMPRHYGGNQGADASTFSELGIEVDTGQAIQYSGLWLANNVCGITNANFQNGEQFATELIGSLATIVYQGPLGTMVPISTIAQPSVINSWEAWSANQAFTADPDYPRWIGFRLEALQATAEQGERFVEANDVTLTLDSTQTPTLTIGAEQDNYSLDCVIANDTTGLSIRVTHFMALNEELEVNTDAKTVTDKSDNSSQFQARKLVEGARLQWLPLAVGENTLSFTDAGTNGVTITIDWEQRYYS